MFTRATVSLIVAAILAQNSFAAVPLYGQCGGSGYSGDTQCVSGGACVKLNDWYSQCQPGASVPSTTITTTTSSTITTSVTNIPTPSSTQAGPIIVLPLGDSITWGMGSNDGNSYRKELKDELTTDGVTIDYIGTQKNGNMPDNDNQGHSGATITQISGYAETALKQKPEVVTLMAGTNDVAQNQDLNNAPTRLTTLVDKIFTASPNATVLVASIPPLSIAQANVNSYNTRLEAAIQAKISAGQHVVWVSMSALTNSDLSDGVHPSAAGYIKMGVAWHAGWVSAKAKGWIR
ncbi:lipolytic enzyme [Ephemerocybe angulata]|uniref:Lipolytic enzyme n=1 Tax=Ephemerocybe angulata TaxID=980116 RepID=A0A8H6HVJ9_9AGAR|nr:lipolytic enzyme [Tulosesus angulatus]